MSPKRKSGGGADADGSKSKAKKTAAIDPQILEEQPYIPKVVEWPFVSKIEMASRNEKEEKEAQLAKNVRQADLQQILARLGNDLDLLKARAANAPSEAVENALDMKYLRDRQEKGKAFVDQWMAKHCVIVEPGDHFENMIPAYLKFKDQFRKDEGQEYVLASLDCTVFPANGNYVAGAVKTLATILSMGANHMGFLQFPVCQSQTSPTAMLKHRHHLENAFVKAGLTIVNSLQVLYSKDGATARDTRSLWQSGQATFHTHFQDHAFQESSAVVQGKLGPCPLARISEFLGYDDAQRPGASARVEQNLDYSLAPFSLLYFCIENTHVFGLRENRCHHQGKDWRVTAMIDGLLSGMPLQDGSTVIFVDVIPNRLG
ncbi:unnamed protein product [Durusdinium trenchii]|uniref:Uncharacterized protein n=1 Tax=Durusdinium trenchii TaxID=1381693 RepID=A0ABP0PD09_9DINO